MSVVAEQAATGWWGGGAPPTDRWPGVTIAIDECGGVYRFDQAAADRVCAFFPRYCSHSKGAFAGQPFDPLDYQTQLILRPIFGWIRVADGLRRFRKAYIEIPKKNGKTQLIAGLALYMLLCDNEPGAEVYVAAADREQARVLFSAAKAMVEANPQLAKRCVVYRNQIVRADDPTAFFQVLSADAATKHGPNIHCLIIDELHAQPDRELFETLTRGVIARRQPLIIEITTAGDDDESICFEEYDYAKRVLSGTIQDERHLPVIFEAGPKDDWADPEVLTRVNPGVGTTIKIEALLASALEAKNEPRKRNDHLRYHTNQWTNQATSWIPIEWYDACDTPLPAMEILKALPCAAGLDLAQKWDLACFELVFRERLAQAITADVVAQDDATAEPVKKSIELNYRIIQIPFFWIPETTMREHEQRDGVPYTIWSQTPWVCGFNLVTPTDGDIIDYSRIYADITTKILPQFPRLKQGFVGYDPAFATDIATSLRDRAGMKVEEVLQNYQHLSEVCHIYEALIKATRVVHGGNRVQRSHVEHVTVRTDDAGRMRPVKPKRAGKVKHIDGVVAGLMGLKMVAKVPDAKRGAGVFYV